MNAIIDSFKNTLNNTKAKVTNVTKIAQNRAEAALAAVKGEPVSHPILGGKRKSCKRKSCKHRKTKKH